MKCYLCGCEIESEHSGLYPGHNPAPLGEVKDRCCDWCNENLVTVLRVRRFQLGKQFLAKDLTNDDK